MLDENDKLARKCAYEQGRREALQEIYIAWSGRAEFDNELFNDLCELMRKADKRYTKVQHKYIDSIGGGEQLKV